MSTNQQPRRRKIWFGDGTEGVIYKESRKISPTGEEWVIYWIKPTQTMIDYWDIKENQRDENGLIRTTYKKTMTEDLNPDPLVGTVLVKCSFKWHDTKLTIEDRWIDIISTLQKQIKILRERCATAEHRERMLLGRPREHAKMMNDLRKEWAGREQAMTLEDEYAMQQQMGGP